MDASEETQSGIKDEIKTVVESSEPQDVGNKVCPVSDEKIDEKTKATYEYEGKIYNFCCTACVDTFKEDPAKYIKKIGEQAQDGSKMEAMPDMEKMEGQEPANQ